jgi:magnesium chelatase family protein
MGEEILRISRRFQPRRKIMARITAATPRGVGAHLIDIEVALGDHDAPPQKIHMTGLLDCEARECALRVQSALKSSGFQLPSRGVTVRLEPETFPKEPDPLDFPIAIALLSAVGLLSDTTLEGRCFYGELALDGTLHPVRGSLAVAEVASSHGFSEVLAPASCAAEAASLGAVRVIPVRSLTEAIGHLSGRAPLPAWTPFVTPNPTGDETLPDLSEIRGQEAAKRVLEVAAAGGHHMLLIGPPGSGKTALARRLPGLLPPMSREESVEATKIQSLVAESPLAHLATQRPFRSPHPAISRVGMTGGGVPTRPGEASLAHAGVLFLDDLPDCHLDSVLDLGQPLKEGRTTVLSVPSHIVFPARFTMVAAMSPCPCGHFDDPGNVCRCSPTLIERHRSRIPGLFLNTIDLFISMAPIAPRDLPARSSEASAEVAARVLEARLVQQNRFPGADSEIAVNAAMKKEDIRRHCQPHDDARRLHDALRADLRLGERAVARILKVARTLADLDRSDSIRNPHLSEAITLARGWETSD